MQKILKLIYARVEEKMGGVVGGVGGEVTPVSSSPAPARRIVTVPSAFRKCPHCPTIFMDKTQLAQHLAQQHQDQQKECNCHMCTQSFLTYEDNTACDTCLQALRQKVVPGKVTGQTAETAKSSITQCGHCHMAFNSTILAQIHCLSTGHNPDLLTSSPFANKTQESSEAMTDVQEAKTSDIGYSTLTTTSTSTCSKGRRGRRRRLIRNNQTLCEICGEECGSVSGLYAHLHANHPSLFPYQCRVCGRGFSQEAGAREHERRHALGELQCPACPLRFSHLSHLHQHTRTHHPNFTNFPCQYCGSVTPTVDALHSHIKVHHGDRLGLPPAFRCHQCQQTFHTGKALASHRSSRHPGTVECSLCGTRVGSRYLSKHINAVHTKEKVHSCNQCGKHFYSRTSLTGHQKRQHGPRKHLCHLCGKGYVHNVELQRHLKAHRNQRDFKCEFCSRSYLKAVDLTYHRRSHTGERPHHCHLCPEAFIKPLGLRKHMLKHTSTQKGNRLKYSKKKIEELTSSVLKQDGGENERKEEKNEKEASESQTHNESSDHTLTQPPPENISEAPHVNNVFQDTPITVPLTQPQPHIQSDIHPLTSSDLHVQQLTVSGIDSGQLEGQLELSPVVENLGSGELLKLDRDLLLESEEGIAEDENNDEGKSEEKGIGGDRADRELTTPAQPVKVIYVHFVEETDGWRSDPPL
ncbi:hypothetical protein Pmani_027369 [Petrolisthes manimaculis]|uniref:C2H2-type domain-containing protein n=1 Tax=Petrolisthes manimaculis TaxID=1843537 RepID=A0AAE1P2U2_9EUCA|nr:hypothetical protein Pmani_028640 [Petrolisthes manimaculis]KAK4300428.1 hypothetical protein Pmani_027369 [Petrolisthes manimaculis]